MKLVAGTDRVHDDFLHESLLKAFVWGAVDEGKAVGQLVLTEELGIDPEYDYPPGSILPGVCMYQFNLDEVVESFIELYEVLPDGKFQDKNHDKAKQMIANLRKLADEVETRIST
ncbi:hypothetical protein GZ77_09385 [Endozoicomonas montiporae]|uniref:Uncharacterized protein n=2 Tax=Endozoicomonas montiporae TaxID=1027273 RepID=A0A081N7W6_9GAMM|nr:hypothetical protein [Endozoicomonas montiporae]AMO55673.1 hypothetical protein EZMO1_1505 [Endozoicomonas montiporae CL-33]AMO55675.1 hypothetical protein EZMO1_1507 [Endozoicomonas montiporae CL-33]KEQ14472.1 hypothetical protein GZ77_08915 [Endozoicomonas montiporae]KEQ14538.1 hypothetical protein GZ77_09380 [Endozoicomonas montiporae]KEQ14539.1 hypothetical protein GZ77_09385 [Endozoicomonas montiporae]